MFPAAGMLGITEQPKYEQKSTVLEQVKHTVRQIVNLSDNSLCE